MSALADVRRLLPLPGFRRLLALRLLSQGADGLVQVALTAYLFFSPERQTTPAAIAAVTAATLLPFTVVGPFTGLVLDRWSRRDVLAAATGVRALLAVGLAAVVAADGPDPLLFGVVVSGFAVNRFVLAGLSAGLPHVVRADELLAANAVVPTAGTLAYVVGLGAGGVAQASTGSDATAVLAAAGVFVLAGLVVARFGRRALGPDRAVAGPGGATAARLVLAGLRDAARHLRARPVAAWAIGLVAAHRFVGGMTLMAGVLLYRSAYADPGDPGDGLAGLSVAVLAAGIGFVLAAAVTGWLVDQWSRAVAVTAGLLVGVPALALLAATLAEPAVVGAAFALGLGGQVVKICADTAVQAEVDDDFRGRVFCLYDMAFNAGLVGAAAIGALVLPPSGRGAGVVAVLAGGLALLALLGNRVDQSVGARRG